MIFCLFKRCKHDYKVIDTYRDYIIDYGFSMDKVLLYCPKCEKQKRMYKKDWDNMKKIESIKRQYKSQ